MRHRRPGLVGKGECKAPRFVDGKFEREANCWKYRLWFAALIDTPLPLFAQSDGEARAKAADLFRGFGESTSER